MSKAVLFSINTPFHLLISKLYIINHKIEQAIIVCNSKNSDIVRLIENDLSLENFIILDLSAHYESKIKKIFNRNKNIRNLKLFLKENTFSNVYVFKDNDIVNQQIIEYCVQNGISPKLIEEGLGIYTVPEEGFKIKKSNLVERLILNYPKKLYNSLGLNSQIYEIIVNEPWALQEEKKVNKIISQHSFSFSSIVFENDFLTYFNGEEKNLPSVEGFTVLYIGQPFSELKLLSPNEERKTLEEIFNLLSTLKLNVVIKPHPSENMEKYEKVIKYPNVSVIESSHIPVELIPSHIKINLAITAYSSSSYYLLKWYGIESISLTELFIKDARSKKINALISKLYEVKDISNFTDFKSLLLKEITRK